MNKNVLTFVNSWFLYSSHLGVMCRSANCRCVAACSLRVVPTALEEHDADRTGQAGKMQRMKESYGEGVANHTGSESCGSDRKVRCEA